jgi:tRNA uridine 5-carboxymethylaminomethyl modification enzyme
MDQVERARDWVRREKVAPDGMNQWLQELGESPLVEPQTLERLVRRPHVSLRDLVGESGPIADPGLDADALTVVEMETKYEGYIRREQERAAALATREGLRLPADIPYMALESLSFEARQKLERVRPRTLGQAGRIPGVSPSDLQNLLVELRKDGKGLRRDAEDREKAPGSMS